MTAPKDLPGRGNREEEAGSAVSPAGPAFVPCDALTASLHEARAELALGPDGPHRLEYMAVRCRTRLLNEEPGQDGWDSHLRAAADEIERLRAMEADAVPRIAQLMRSHAALVEALDDVVDALKRVRCGAANVGYAEIEAGEAALALARGGK